MTTIQELFRSELNQLTALIANEAEFKSKESTAYYKFLTKSAEYYEFLITYSRFNALITTHAQSKTTNTAAYLDFKTFLSNRWDRIKNTDFAYLSLQEDQLNNICVAIARKVAGMPSPMVDADKLLMPTAVAAAANPDPKRLWNQIITEEYLDDLIPNVINSLKGITTFIYKIKQNLPDEGHEQLKLVFKKIKFDRDLLPLINPAKTNHSQGNELYWILLYLNDKKKTKLLEAYADENNTLWHLLYSTEDRILLIDALNNAIAHLNWAIEEDNPPEDRLYNEINNINREALSDHELRLLTEFTFRAALLIDKPSHAGNLERCTQLAKEIGQRSWGQIIFASFLGLVGVLGIAAVVGAVIAVSHGSTLPFVLFFADKLVAGITGAISALSIIGSGIAGYKSKQHAFKVAAAGFFKEYKSAAQNISDGHQYAALVVDDDGDDEESADDLSDSSSSPQSNKPAAVIKDSKDSDTDDEEKTNGVKQKTDATATASATTVVTASATSVRKPAPKPVKKAVNSPPLKPVKPDLNDNAAFPALSSAGSPIGRVSAFTVISQPTGSTSSPNKSFAAAANTGHTARNSKSARRQ